ncbi:MAG: hypothetical protein IJR17_05950 [Clostridia bacterium]|nr:hypothetical protein [Clostridia bacterium]
MPQEAIYAQAKALLEEGGEESLKRAMELFASLRGYLDADRQFRTCRTQLGRLRWLRESAALKVEEERFEAKVARWKKAGLTALIGVLTVLTLVITIAMVRFHRYREAADMYTAGEYARAADAFQAMNGYRDTRARVYMCAVGLYHAGRYEEALPYFIWLDGDYDNGYYLNKCYERMNAQRP